MILFYPELSDSLVFEFVFITELIFILNANIVGDSANRPTIAQLRAEILFVCFVCLASGLVVDEPIV